MDTLPNEIILLVFENILLITDKRQFLKSCKKYNLITKHNFSQYEGHYVVKEFSKINDYCVEKFTLELCHDLYFDRMPSCYINPKNDVLIESLSYFNCIKLLDVAKSNNCHLGNVSRWAALNGHLDVLEWASNNNCKFDAITCSNAAKNGHLECLKSLRSIDCEWSYLTCARAAGNGHLDVLQWAHENGCDWNILTTVYAARDGQLKCLKYAHENGCEWNAWTCINAAHSGHFDCLKYARENGCDWNNLVRLNAKIRGHDEILNWAIENGCPE